MRGVKLEGGNKMLKYIKQTFLVFPFPLAFVLIYVVFVEIYHDSFRVYEMSVWKYSDIHTKCF